MSNSYVDPKFMSLYIEDKFGINLKQLNEKIMGSKMELDDIDIIMNLRIRFNEKYPDVFDRNKLREDYKNKKLDNVRISSDYEDYMNDFVFKPEVSFKDKLITKEYEFSNLTYECYKQSIDVLKEKSVNLLFIISKLSDKDIEEIKSYIKDFDILLNDNLDINEDDVMRLLKPTIYNISKLFELVDNANNYETYVNNKTSRISFYEKIPDSRLQVKNLEYDNLNFDGYIALSDRQKEKLSEKDRKTFIKVMDVLKKEL